MQKVLCGLWKGKRLFRRWPLAYLLLVIPMLCSLAACVGVNSTKLIRNASSEAALAGVVVVPEEAAKVCTPAALPEAARPSISDYRVFGVLQTGRLEVCEERRALAVDAMRLHNAAQEKLAAKLKPKAWWHFW